MTPEQRLDRLERIAELLVRAGMRARREMNQKINILLDARIKNNERFAQLADSQAHTDCKLDALIDIIRKEREERRGESDQS